MHRININMSGTPCDLETGMRKLTEYCRASTRNTEIHVANVMHRNRRKVNELILPAILTGYEENLNPKIVFTFFIENGYKQIEDLVNSEILKSRKNIDDVVFVDISENKLINQIKEVSTKHLIHEFGQMAREKYRRRTLKDCVEGAIYDLAALYRGDDEITNWFFMNINVDDPETIIQEFCDNFDNVKMLFNVLLRSINYV